MGLGTRLNKEISGGGNDSGRLDDFPQEARVSTAAPMTKNAATRSSSAFTRTELMVTVSVIIALGGLIALWINKSGAAPRKYDCESNLKALGAAMAMYEKDNDERLPYAFIRYDDGHSIAWDTLVFPFVRLEGYDPRKDRAPKGVLRCPSDPLPGTDGQRRRTYSMPWHKMDLDFEENWPPGSNNATGVGLWWQSHVRGQIMAELTNLTATAADSSATSSGPAQAKIPCFRLSMIPAPADTLLLTEQVRSNNISFSFTGATIRSPSEYVDKSAIDPEQIHSGRFNHLMVDGHVELLKPEQTMGKNSGLQDVDTADPKTRNIWTVFPGD